MPTARERMLELSQLPSPDSARNHFLSITQTGAPIEIQIFDETVVSLEGDLVVSLDDDLCG